MNKVFAFGFIVCGLADKLEPIAGEFVSVDRPHQAQRGKAAVAGLGNQIFEIVRGAPFDGLARLSYNDAAIGRPVHVPGAGQEGFDVLHVRLADAGQFGAFVMPDRAKQLHRFLALGAKDRFVGKVFRSRDGANG